MITLDLNPGELMRIHRIRKDLTQESLADKIGSFQVRISRLENGVATPTHEEIKMIEDALETLIWTRGKGDAMNAK